MPHGDNRSERRRHWDTTRCGMNFIGERMSARTARGIAWILVGIYFLLAGTGLFLMVLTGTTIGSFPITLFIIAMIAVGIWPVIGALIVSHHPRHPVGWLLFAAFPVAAIDMFSIGYTSYATFSATGSPPVPAPILIWLNWSGAPFAILAFTMMNLIFPSGKFLSPRWRIAAWTCAGTLLGYLLLLILKPGPLGLLPSLDNPYAVTKQAWAALAPLYLLSITIFILCSLASIISLFLRLRRARGDEHQQVKWLLFPAILFWTNIPFALLAEYDPSGIALAIGVGLTLISVPLMVIAVAIAIFRHRLYDLNLLINRTLVYGALTGSVIALYALIVGAFGILFQSGGNLIVALAATGLAAVLFQPLRARLQRAVNHMMYGERDEPFTVLRRLGERLESGGMPEDILAAIVQTVSQALKLPYAEITLRRGREFVPAAWYGAETGEKAPFPIQYQAQTIGYLNVALRRPEESLAKPDEELLHQIARQAGPVAYAVQLTRDLRQSRARLVTAREEERRRLRRDLHDGLGPVLASQGLKIAAVSHLLDRDPQAARALLDELASQNEATVAEIRRLVYALRPPELDELGLAGAIRDYADGLNLSAANGAGLKIDVQPSNGDLPGLPAAVEVTAYRIATEALTNVTRHARARHCTVSLNVKPNGREKVLLLEISDDGIGLSNNGKTGIGMNSMRERAEEVQGELQVQSSPSQGTRVVARLPLTE
jgi:two-component system NarL family sensor kinase